MTTQLALKQMANSAPVMDKLNGLLGTPELAASFASSMISVVASNPMLQRCEPKSVLGAAMVAAMLRLPLIPSLGMAYVVPFKNQAQFQIGYKGLVELALRSGQFRTIINEVVYEGQLVSMNRFTGEYIWQEARKSDKPVGVMARFDLVNGFSKTIYWTMEEIETHAKKYSQAYRSGYSSPWKSDFLAMAKKTVLKSLLNKYAPKSLELMQALRYDQAAVKADPEHLDIETMEPEYVDNSRVQAAVEEDVKPQNLMDDGTAQQ